MAGDPVDVKEQQATPTSTSKTSQTSTTEVRPGRRERVRRWPWLVAAGALGVFFVANVLYPSGDADIVWTGMFSAIIVAFVLVGALLAARVPSNPIGPVILGAGAMLAATIAIGTLGIVAAQGGSVALEWLAVASIVNELGFLVPIVIILVGIPLIFPDGKLLSPRWRWVIVLAASALAAQAVSQILRPGPVGYSEMPNPFAVPGLEALTGLLDSFASWSSVVCYSAAVLAVVIRYRRGDDVQRHQLKWLIAVAAVAAIAFPTAFIFPESPVADAAFILGLMSLLALPIVIGIAVLRYRLYDIDRIISRTIAWALISAVLLGAFAILVVGLQAALAGLTQGQTLAVAASTLIAFSLFQPVRRRVQGVVDRRFDRAGYDAQRTADAFAARMRTEVDLGALTRDLELTVSEVIRPTTTGLWVHRRDARG
jgi:MFS family permease